MNLQLRRIAALLIASILLVGGAAACSDDSDPESSESTEEGNNTDSTEAGDGDICTLIEAYAEDLPEGEAWLAALESQRELAPPNVRPDYDSAIAYVEVAIDEDSTDLDVQQAEVAAQRSVIRLAEFAQSECDVTVPGLGG